MDQHQVTRLKKAIGEDSLIFVWTGEWLEHLNMFSEAQIYDIIKFVVTSLKQHETADILNLIVCDSRWVTISGACSFWDAQLAEAVSQMPQAAITIITCDCLALIKRKSNVQSRDFNPKNSD
jgi:hypothetical protein